MKAAVLNAKRTLSNPRLQQQQQQQTRLFDICRQHGLEDIRTKGYCYFNAASAVSHYEAGIFTNNPKISLWFEKTSFLL
jgi:hypothetical protein